MSGTVDDAGADGHDTVEPGFPGEALMAEPAEVPPAVGPWVAIDRPRLQIPNGGGPVRRALTVAFLSVLGAAGFLITFGRFVPARHSTRHDWAVVVVLAGLLLLVGSRTRLRKRIYRITVALVSSAAITIGVVAFVLPTPVEPEPEPYVVHVVEDQARYAVTRMPVRDGRTVPPPTTPDWVNTINAVPACENRIIVHLEALEDISIGFGEVRIVSRSQAEPVGGSLFEAPRSGESIGAQAVVYLDTNPPAVTYQRADPYSGTDTRNLSLVEGDTFDFVILASTAAYTTTWQGDLELDVDGRSHTIALGAHVVTSLQKTVDEPTYTLEDAAWKSIGPGHNYACP